MSLSPLFLLMASAAEEKAAPVIDIDGTVFIQFALFLGAYVVLKYLFFTPYLEMRKRRTAGIDGVQKQAEEMEHRARELSDEYDRRIKEARGRSDEERLRLREQGLSREREVLAEARTLAKGRLDETRDQIAQQVDSARADLVSQAQPLARQIAGKILGREV
jgi:F-type H+-transporting ATPase subunit b